MSDTKDPSGTEIERTAGGRFAVGNKGGPGGRKAMPPNIRCMLEDASEKATKVLIDGLDAEDYDTRLKAATIIHERLYGKPAQAVVNEDGTPIRIGIMLLPEEKVE